MARKAFSGDHSKELPKGKMEPYRLWFEFLKLAKEVQPDKVDHKFYEQWGDVTKERFDDWFTKNWQRLFSTPASLTIIHSLTEAEQSLKNEENLLIRIDKTGPVKRQIEDFKKILKTHRDPNSKKSVSRPAFEIISNRSMNNASIRAMLKLLKLYYRNNQEIDEATKEYYNWASDWNRKIKDKKWKYEPIRIPEALKKFAVEIQRHEDESAKSPKKLKRSIDYSLRRSDAGRFLRKAKKILDNVSSGKYPGIF